MNNKNAAPGRPSAWPAAIGNLAGILAVAGAVAWAASRGGALALGIPVVWWCAALAFAVQWLVFVPSYLRRTEHFFDLTGSITYISVVILALVLTDVWDQRSLLVTAMVAIWATRLGSFLFQRVRRDGRDGRFDRIKRSAPAFFVAWTLQGLWVFLTLAAGLAAMTAGGAVDLGLLDLIGVTVWFGGFLIEVFADAQKRSFRRDPDNRGRFIDTGLWAWSRHPNYFGEIVLWLGIAIVASATHEGWRWLTWISPVFVALLLMRISGIPLLEKRADKRWGGEADYQAYKERTPVLIPRPPAKP